MDYPTPEALALVDEFSTNDEVRDSLCLCLSAPNGAVDDVCSALDRKRFEVFEKFALVRGVTLFAPEEPAVRSPRRRFGREAQKPGADSSFWRF